MQRQQHDSSRSADCMVYAPAKVEYRSDCQYRGHLLSYGLELHSFILAASPVRIHPDTWERTGDLLLRLWKLVLLADNERSGADTSVGVGLQLRNRKGDQVIVSPASSEDAETFRT